MAGPGLQSECSDTGCTQMIWLTYIYIEYRDGAKKMVAKGKTYGKKKGRDLIAIFNDLSITPSKPGTSDLLPLHHTMGSLTVVGKITNAISRVLAATPNSQNEPLLQSNTEPEGEQDAQATDQDDSK